MTVRWYLEKRKGKKDETGTMDRVGRDLSGAVLRGLGLVSLGQVLLLVAMVLSVEDRKNVVLEK